MLVARTRPRVGATLRVGAPRIGPLVGILVVVVQTRPRVGATLRVREPRLGPPIGINMLVAPTCSGVREYVAPSVGVRGFG